VSNHRKRRSDPAQRQSSSLRGLVLDLGVLRRVRLHAFGALAVRAADHPLGWRCIVRRAAATRPLHALRQPRRHPAASELERAAFPARDVTVPVERLLVL
jgi:hypothetical protein